MDDRRWLVIGAPMDGSGTDRGERRAPSVLRGHGLAERLGGIDLGELDVQVADARRDARTGITGFNDVVHGSRVVRDAVATALSAGWRPLVLGGCCSIVPGVLAGVRRANGPASLVFVDGHLDLYDGESSTTGELAGMDLAVVIGIGPPELTELAGAAPIVDPGDVIAIGDADGERTAPLRRTRSGRAGAVAAGDRRGGAEGRFRRPSGSPRSSAARTGCTSTSTCSTRTRCRPSATRRARG